MALSLSYRRSFLSLFISLCLALTSILSVCSTESPIRYDFSKNSAEENGVSLHVPGFGALPLADVIFGTIPTDNAFTGATDGIGIKIVAGPGEGVLIVTRPIYTDHFALIRCSVRSSASHVSVYLASIDQEQYAFVSTITPNNGAYFLNRYNRIADIALPPSNGFQVLMQIVNTSQMEALTAYVDNLEVLLAGTENLEWGVNDIIAGPLEPTPTSTVEPSRTPTPEPSQNITVPLNLPVDAKPLEMVLIKAGTFTMGSPSSEWSREPDETQHQVNLTKDFYLGQNEVTQAQWQAVMGSNPASSYGVGSNYPVYNVSWKDCQTFIQKLNQLGQGEFRLPTEAEWEYACRAGASTTFYWGDDPDESQMNDYAWYVGANPTSGSKEVGLKLPNAWGLFDMSGNVWEWCYDWYGNYSAVDQIDPTGQQNGSRCVIRGGSWATIPELIRSASRGEYNPEYTWIYLGFRVAATRVNTIPLNTPTPQPTPLPTVKSVQTITVPLDLHTDAKPLEMVLIKAGTFTMGSPTSERGRWGAEWQPHQVTLTNNFYLGKYEVTQAQWQAVMGSNPSYFKGDNRPMESVSWNDIQAFIQELNQLNQGTFRLPTEAEWEYACRAGTSTRFSFGDVLECPDSGESYCDIMDNYMWWLGNNTYNGSASGTKEVGIKLPNPWGLFDIHGNVWEWCSDWWQESYLRGAQSNPQGPDSGTYKVIRGGTWSDQAWNCRSAYRYNESLYYSYYYFGFRLVMTQ